MKRVISRATSLLTLASDVTGEEGGAIVAPRSDLCIAPPCNYSIHRRRDRRAGRSTTNRSARAHKPLLPPTVGV